MTSANRQGQEGLSFANTLRDCLVCGVIIVDSRQRVASLTSEAAEILGSEPGQKASPHSLAELPAPLQQIVCESLAAGQPLAHRRLELTVAGHGPLALSVSVVPLQPGRSDSGVALTLHDLTAVRHIEEHLQQLDRLANVGTLAAGMAHEIRNALVAGKTFVELLLEKRQDAELVEIVRRELGRIDAIISRMLKFSSPLRPAFEAISLHEVLEHSLRLVEPQREAKAIILAQSFRAAPDRISGDEYALQQALANLFLNALEAMGPGGTLTVSTETLPAGTAPGAPTSVGLTPPVTAKAPGTAGTPKPTEVGAPGAEPASLCETAGPPLLRILIQDTGPGIPAENLERLFKPFFTTKPTGTGLGLAITLHILQKHHGAISVESPPGQGARFSIVLPVMAKLD